jgi:hypothetical protein
VQGLLKVDGMARLGVRTLKGGLLGVDVSLNGSGPMTGIIDLVSSDMHLEDTAAEHAGPCS